MSVVVGLSNYTRDRGVCALAIGVFDGVHWGHREIFRTLNERARELGARSVALTFDRHPAELFAPASAPEYINTIEQRIEQIREAGVDEVVIAEFDLELANLSKEDFLRKVVGNTFGAKHVVVGSNFRFGRNREGDTRYLAQFLPEVQVGLSVVPAVIISGGPVSSTRIRALVNRGDIAEASKLLGKRFTLRGLVVAGEQIGRSLGFPTANLQTEPRQLVPADGVYAVEAAIGKSVFSGVCNIGQRPTFGGGLRTIEVHFMGFEGNLYGTKLDVVFIRRLRDEMVFERPEHLAAQIREDLKRVRGHH
jgi:riboflavin kinase/FMN adenylyltransferase